jgi:transcriptional regulator with XRE-family HTH domain
MDLDYFALGVRIHSLRKKKGLTQQVLAEQVGIETSNISHIERGASKVGLSTLVRIANALSVSLDDLVCDSILCEKAVFVSEISDELKDCTPEEIRMISDMVKAMKATLRKRK